MGGCRLYGWYLVYDDVASSVELERKWFRSDMLIGEYCVSIRTKKGERGVRKKEEKEIWFITYWRENFVTIEGVDSIKWHRVIGGKGCM